MYLCIDIGGTKTIVALVNSRGKILHSVKFPTVPDQNVFYDQLSQQIRINFVASEVLAFAVAMPGIVKNNKCTWLGNLPWKNFDIAKKLTKDFGKPTFVENDANLGALGEARNNPEKNLYFTFSTGIGGGVVSEGKIIEKYQTFEPGHNIYTYHGEKKEWEDIAAASAINKKYGKLVSEISGRDEWNDITDRMLLGLAPLTAEIKPDRIIFGGPLGLELPRYRRQLRKKLSFYLPKNVKMPTLVKARHGSFSVIQGCYLYAKSCQKNS
ncbi:MAG: ROK family protein [Candidatus Saccharibacteria bacterium]|nr:ROK family protein [Candidatus Saccharibacteria bacterium]